MSISTYTPLYKYNHTLRPLWTTTTSTRLKYIRVIDAVVNIFSGVFCNCVIEYILCGCCGCCLVVWLLRYRIIFCFDDFLYSYTVYHTHHTVSTIIIKTTYFIHCSFNGNDIDAAIGTLRRESKKKENLHWPYNSVGPYYSIGTIRILPWTNCCGQPQRN